MHNQKVCTLKCSAVIENVTYSHNYCVLQRALINSITCLHRKKFKRKRACTVGLLVPHHKAFFI